MLCLFSLPMVAADWFGHVKQPQDRNQQKHGISFQPSTAQLIQNKKGSYTTFSLYFQDKEGFKVLKLISIIYEAFITTLPEKHDHSENTEMHQRSMKT